ncbi:MAG: VOC family protein [Polyangiaceae bacterium]
MLKLHHLAVVVRDLNAAERFYSGLLGLPVTQRWEGPDGRPRSVWVALSDGGFLALEKASADSPTRSDQAPGLHCLALGIPRREREPYREKLTAAGFPIEHETRFTLYVRDPDGNLIGFSHYPDGIYE